MSCAFVLICFSYEESVETADQIVSLVEEVDKDRSISLALDLSNLLVDQASIPDEIVVIDDDRELKEAKPSPPSHRITELIENVLQRFQNCVSDEKLKVFFIFSSSF